MDGLKDRKKEKGRIQEYDKERKDTGKKFERDTD
jgi:hypothetical protein